MKEYNLTWGKLKKTSRDRLACSGVGLVCTSARRGLSKYLLLLNKSHVYLYIYIYKSHVYLYIYI